MIRNCDLSVTLKERLEYLPQSGLMRSRDEQQIQVLFSAK